MDFEKKSEEGEGSVLGPGWPGMGKIGDGKKLGLFHRDANRSRCPGKAFVFFLILHMFEFQYTIFIWFFQTPSPFGIGIYS